MSKRTGRPRGGHNIKDLTGQRFDRLTVTGRATTNSYGYACWFCACVCGNTVVVCGHDLRSGTRSCGCLRNEIAKANILLWNTSDARKFLRKLWDEAKNRKEVQS